MDNAQQVPTGRLGGTLVSIELVKYPDVFLRKVSKDVTFPLDDKTRRLIKWMKELCINTMV